MSQKESGLMNEFSSVYLMYRLVHELILRSYQLPSGVFADGVSLVLVRVAQEELGALGSAADGYEYVREFLDEVSPDRRISRELRNSVLNRLWQRLEELEGVGL